MPHTIPDRPAGSDPRTHETGAAQPPAVLPGDVAGRGRVAHQVATGAFLTAAGYSLMVIWSLLGGPVSPDTLMPFSAPHPHPHAPVSTARPAQPLPPSNPAPPAPRPSSGRGQ